MFENEQALKDELNYNMGVSKAESENLKNQKDALED